MNLQPGYDTVCKLSVTVYLTCESIGSLGALYSAFSSCAAVLYGCQMLAVLEVINAAVGLVNTPVFPAMIQARLCNCVPHYTRVTD